MVADNLMRRYSLPTRVTSPTLFNEKFDKLDNLPVHSNPNEDSAREQDLLKKGFKFLGGKTLGVLGMLQATSSKADQPTYKSTGDKRYKKDESQQIRDLLTKHGLKGGDYK